MNDCYRFSIVFSQVRLDCGIYTVIGKMTDVNVWCVHDENSKHVSSPRSALGRDRPAVLRCFFTGDLTVVATVLAKNV